MGTFMIGFGPDEKITGTLNADGTVDGLRPWDTLADDGLDPPQTFAGNSWTRPPAGESSPESRISALEAEVEMLKAELHRLIRGEEY